MDAGGVESRPGLHIERSVAVTSRRLGLSGICDLVEIVSKGDHSTFTPVEYKAGGPKNRHCDLWQLCAQAMALEEMTETKVEHGYLYYYKMRHRQEIRIDNALRTEVIAASDEMHRYFAAGIVPSAHRQPGCDCCSLIDLCMPDIGSKTVAGYLAAYLQGDCRCGS